MSFCMLRIWCQMKLETWNWFFHVYYGIYHYCEIKSLPWIPALSFSLFLLSVKCVICERTCRKVERCLQISVFLCWSIVMLGWIILNLVYLNGCFSSLRLWTCMASWSQHDWSFQRIMFYITDILSLCPQWQTACGRSFF